MARSKREMQTAIGLGFLCLATLSFQALMYPTRAAQPSTNPLITTTSDFLNVSAPNAASLQAIQSAIAQLSSLIGELNSTLSTVCPNCDFVSRDYRRYLKPSMEEVDAVELAFGGAFVMLVWIAGLVIFLSSLADRSHGFMERVVACGLLGANVSVVCSIFWIGSMPRYGYVVYALWSAYAAMVGGILYSKESDEEVPRREINKS